MMIAEKKLQIVHLEDNIDDAGLTEITLRKAGLSFELTLIETKDEFIEVLNGGTPDLILSDHSLPGFDSIEAYKIMNSMRPSTPFILLTGSVSEAFAVDCLLAGIDDYILKTNMIRLPSSISRVLSKKKILQEKDVIETLHTELQDSVNYARRIQQAVLPTPEELDNSFYPSFVHYKPRNVVSGDMYWLTNVTTTDERNLMVKVLAVYDCTGHGIPGAFMSLLAFSLLNETIKHPHVNSPADVLQYLNKKLPVILNRNGKERIADGLDIAICAIDQHNVLHFAGANRPVWILRKNDTTHELMELKAAKTGISSHTDPQFIFENQSLPLEKGDRIFLFTDGIIDQFGGPSGKKLTSRKLREILVDTAHLSFEKQQRYLLDFFENWQHGYEQIDDQLFIGMEIN